MKIKRFLLILFIVLLLVCNASVSSLAINTSFATDEMDSKNQQVFLSSIELTLINDEPQKSEIICFDVRNDGLLAIGTGDSSKKSISVYDINGTFQYGYTFNCNQSFGVEWDDNDIIIYFVRSDVAAWFNVQGSNIEIKNIKDTIDNNSYWNNSVFARERVIDKNKYTMKNNNGLLNVFASSYSQIVKTDADGNVTTIYDVDNTYETLILFTVLTISIAIIVFIVIRQFIKIKQNAI